MQSKTFLLPILGGEEIEAEMNEWLRNHVVVSKQAELREVGGVHYWAILFFYASKDETSNGGNRVYNGSSSAGRGSSKKRVDYRETLSIDDFAVYSALRDVRNAIHQEDGYPAYVICTNEQLAEMVRARCATLEDLKRIEGFGEARAQKYGRRLLDALRKGFEARNISLDESLNPAPASPDASEPPFEIPNEDKRREFEEIRNDEGSSDA